MMRKIIPRATRLLTILTGSIESLARHPRLTARALSALPDEVAGLAFSNLMRPSGASDGRRDTAVAGTEVNPLEAYFDGHQTGLGVWKWKHYFSVYHRYLGRFVGREFDLAEIGVFSGGSLQMWREYFGEGCRIHGIDIKEACKDYEDARTRIHIGDQSDRAFWRRFKSEVPSLDVVIDDGSHQYEHQRATMEELLPHLRPGGVYVCEDIHGRWHSFSSYLAGFLRQLNAQALLPGPILASQATGIQRSIYSMHFYPYLVVIERSAHDVESFAAPRQGTEWQPFYDWYRPTETASTNH
jgi:hypothetical protein